MAVLKLHLKFEELQEWGRRVVMGNMKAVKLFEQHELGRGLAL